ncbi:MAG: PRC-barrel domain-containing protein [Bryobacterales bacterium]|nr:PRC-barrel domain-containing protein [Bryobacterales bacterium]
MQVTSSGSGAGSARIPKVLSASTLIGDGVRNLQDEDLGKVEEIMIDLDSGRVAYVVVSFGGFLGLGSKLFAIPWDAFRLDSDREVFILDVDRQALENAPGFDKDNWPDFADREWGSQIHSYYGYDPYWKRESSATDWEHTGETRRY